MYIKSRETVIATQLSVTVSRYWLNIYSHMLALTQHIHTVSNAQTSGKFSD